MKHPFRHFLINAVIGIVIATASLSALYVYAPKAMINVATPITINAQKKDQYILYYSPTCSVCQQVYRTYFWRSVTGQLKFASVANEQNKEAAAALGITKVPTLVHYKKGKVV
ncbi:thioredoxin family protein, partial [Lacticaseibacillus rhamnosus]